MYVVPFDITLSHSTQRYTICVYTVPFDITLSHFTTRHHMCVRCTIRHYAVPFDTTLHHMCVRCTILHYAVPYDATLQRLCTVLQMSVRLFAIELVHFTISCSNSTWATRPFIIWLNYPCLGCSVSRRKTKPSIIWPCHSFISYSILQLIFAVFLVVTAVHCLVCKNVKQRRPLWRVTERTYSLYGTKVKYNLIIFNRSMIFWIHDKKKSRQYHLEQQSAVAWTFTMGFVNHNKIKTYRCDTQSPM